MGINGLMGKIMDIHSDLCENCKEQTEKEEYGMEVVQEFLKSMKNDLETRSDFGHLALKHSPRVVSFDKAVQVIIEKPLRDKAVQATAVKVLKDQHIQVDKAGFSLAKETQVEPELSETGVHSQANQNEIRAARRKNLLYAEKEIQADVEDCERD